jgi:hypothetical protein
VPFRGTTGRLATVGQAPLPLDVYRWFLATLSPYPVFQQYTLLSTVANGAIAQQTFEAYAAYVLPQLHNILALSNPRPFAEYLEGQEDGADDDILTGDLLYPNPSYPTINSAQQSLYPTNYGTYTAPQPCLPHLLTLVFHLTLNTPWQMLCTPTHRPLRQILPLPPPPQTKPAQDREATSKASAATSHRRKRKRAPLTPSSHALLSCAIPSCIFIATTMAG